jgi:hypothetical protein
MRFNARNFIARLFIPLKYLLFVYNSIICLSLTLSLPGTVLFVTTMGCFKSLWRNNEEGYFCHFNDMHLVYLGHLGPSPVSQKISLS